MPVRAASKSELEELLVWQIRQAGLPPPVREYRFHPFREWRLDLAYTQHRLGIEIEGGIFRFGRHNRPAGMMADMEKYNAAALMGWLVYRISPPTVRSYQFPKTLRLLLHGESPVNMVAMPLPFRVWSRITIGSADECWLWSGAQNGSGYGQLRIDGECLLSTRIVWGLTHGEMPPDDLAILHSCNNPPCCNPSHLRVGTLAQNAHDMHEAGNGNTQKLSADDVTAIRRMLVEGLKTKTIADRFGVTNATVRMIARGKSWSWLQARAKHGTRAQT